MLLEKLQIHDIIEKNFNDVIVLLLERINALHMNGRPCLRAGFAFLYTLFNALVIFYTGLFLPIHKEEKDPYSIWEQHA